MNLFKQYSSHTNSQNYFKNSKKCRMGRIRRMWRFLTFFIPFLIFKYFGVWLFQAPFEHPLSIMNLFKQYLSHMKSQKIFKTSKKWTMGRIWRMWGFLTFFVPFLIFKYFWNLIFFSDIIWTPTKYNEPI